MAKEEKKFTKLFTGNEEKLWLDVFLSLIKQNPDVELCAKTADLALAEFQKRTAYAQTNWLIPFIIPGWGLKTKQSELEIVLKTDAISALTAIGAEFAASPI